jgi:hypothetical protein
MMGIACKEVLFDDLVDTPFFKNSGLTRTKSLLNDNRTEEVMTTNNTALFIHP